MNNSFRISLEFFDESDPDLIRRSVTRSIPREEGIIHSFTIDHPYTYKQINGFALVYGNKVSYHWTLASAEKAQVFWIEQSTLKTFSFSTIDFLDNLIEISADGIAEEI